ncbi:hydantoinase/oxoprolinase family protein [Acerihabitans sp. KWT182]|uniref:Hydantoinase/oxoprolinase family protein n=1 Tax=Acerihabitans sp. KWT182 TaxID=3157919 RepID=A0AAU7QEU2_9GAMM
MEKAASGVYEIVNQSMISAMKVHIAERGDDPRKFYLFAFGGAGPAHAYELARSAGMKGIIVPDGAGAASAMGLVTSGIAFDYARSLVMEVNGQTWPRIAALFEEMAAEGAALLAGVKLSRKPEEIKVQYQMDLRHKGQGHEMTMDVPEALVKAGDYRGICELFYTTHRQKYGHEHRHLAVQLMTCRATVSGHNPEIRLPRLPVSKDAPSRKSTRRVYFPELKAYAPTPIYDRYALGAGMAFNGPAIVEERECTLVVGPSGRVRVDEFGSIFIDIASSNTFAGEK